MKFIDYSHITINWVKIGVNPFKSSYGGSLSQPLTVIVNGYFGIFFACMNGNNPSNSMGAVLYLWDANGNRCEYHTSNFVNGASIQNIVPNHLITQYGNVFNYATNDGNQWHFVCPNIFTPGAVYVIPPGLQKFTSPCGLGVYHQTKYFKAQNRIVQEYIKAYSLSDDYWVSVFDSNQNYITGGYLGNSAADLFDQTDLVLPPYTYAADVFYRNGLTAFGNFGSSGNVYQVFGFFTPTLNGNENNLTCGAPSDYYASGNNFNQFYGYRDYKAPAFYTTSVGLGMGVTDKVGYLLFPDSYYNFLLSKDYIIGLATPTGSGLYGFLSNTKKLYWQNDTSGLGHNSGDIYIANFPAVNIEPVPSASVLTYGNLANYHRAISPDGLFNA